jgi:hypothetical protein
MNSINVWSDIIYRYSKIFRRGILIQVLYTETNQLKLDTLNLDTEVFKPEFIDEILRIGSLGLGRVVFFTETNGKDYVYCYKTFILTDNLEVKEMKDWEKCNVYLNHNTKNF